MDYRICAILSQSRHLHKADFPLVKRKKRRVLQWNPAFVHLQVIVDTYTSQILHIKTLKNSYFVVEYFICAI